MQAEHLLVGNIMHLLLSQSLQCTCIYAEDFCLRICLALLHFQPMRLTTYSNYKQAYTNLDREKSHIVNTAWAMLALMKAGQVITLFNTTKYLMGNCSRAYLTSE